MDLQCHQGMHDLLDELGLVMKKLILYDPKTGIFFMVFWVNFSNILKQMIFLDRIWLFDDFYYFVGKCNDVNRAPVAIFVFSYEHQTDSTVFNKTKPIKANWYPFTTICNYYTCFVQNYEKNYPVMWTISMINV
jgi:hypothetical protein